MEHSIVIAGFGGQGVLFAGQLLAYAGMESGRHVTWIPSYGPEMRGGTANCTVIISDDPIGAPIVSQPTCAVVLNQPSYEKYLRLVQPDGVLVVNSAIVTTNQVRAEIDTVYVPANMIASEVGNVKLLNMAAIGALLGRCPILPLEAVATALTNHLASHKANLLEANLKILEKGYQFSKPLGIAA